MVENVGGGLEWPDLVSFLKRHRAEILDTYLHKLGETGSKIAADPLAMEQARLTADLILVSVARGVGADPAELDENATNLARNIGFTRAAAGIHSQESLRAASLLFECVVTCLSRHLADGHRSTAVFAELVLTLERDISARIRESSTAYTGFLLNQVHDAQLRERRRIARELHDRIGHGVAVAQRRLELYDHYRSSDPVKARAQAETALDAVHDTMRELRVMTAELHPTDGIDGLEKALITYLHNIDIGEDVHAELEVNGDESWASALVLDETFLIVREAARNAFSHGRPTAVHIRVNVAPHELHASVKDNGQGFAADAVHSSGGMGLASMRERAELLGGTVTITSAPGAGTLVELSVSLPT